MKENEKFVEMLKTKYPDLDIEKLLSIFDKKIKEVRGTNLVLSLDCNLNQHIFASAINEYLK